MKRVRIHLGQTPASDQWLEVEDYAERIVQRYFNEFPKNPMWYDRSYSIEQKWDGILGLNYLDIRDAGHQNWPDHMFADLGMRRPLPEALRGIQSFPP